MFWGRCRKLPCCSCRKMRVPVTGSPARRPLEGSVPFLLLCVGDRRLLLKVSLSDFGPHIPGQGPALLVLLFLAWGQCRSRCDARREPGPF